MRVDLFQEISVKHGGLAENEIFFFAPALAFGEAESIQYIEKENAILPVAPETLYEIEGETVSLWALTFVSRRNRFIAINFQK